MRYDDRRFTLFILAIKTYFTYHFGVPPKMLTIQEYKDLPDSEKDYLLKGSGFSRHDPDGGHYWGTNPNPSKIEEVLEELRRLKRIL